LHQIYLSGDLPDRLQRHVAELRKRNPGWNYKLYDTSAAERLIGDEYGIDMLRTFRRIDPRYGAARADLLRHLILYKRGGVYLDIKSDLRMPLDNVIRPEDEYILTQWRNALGEPFEGFGLHRDLAHVPGGEYQNYVIIAAPGHAFSKAAIDVIVRNIRNYRPWSPVGRTGVIRTTGPIAYTLAVHSQRALHPHRLATEEEIGAAPSIVDYDHFGTFKTHYSTLKTPVVALGRTGTLLSGLFVKAREWKARSTMLCRTKELTFSGPEH
jgi:mannosyltransferase OCH1-like enzyme